MFLFSNTYHFNQSLSLLADNFDEIFETLLDVLDSNKLSIPSKELNSKAPPPLCSTFDKEGKKSAFRKFQNLKQMVTEAVPPTAEGRSTRIILFVFDTISILTCTSSISVIYSFSYKFCTTSQKGEESTLLLCLQETHERP